VGVLWCAAALGAAALALWCALAGGVRRAGDGPAPGQPQELPEPPFTEVRSLNAGADARYVGSAACAGCHKEHEQSYLLTAHSRASAEVDPAAEPPDGSFTQRASGRSYRVYRKGGQLRHEELLAAEGEVVARVDLPVRYRIGSGRHARAYAVEAGGFLHESPVTWYAAAKGWGMSPGYDVPNHASFERPVVLECLSCHTGRAEEVGGAISRLAVTEHAIGCERCHGPGSLHREFHAKRKLAPGADDATIVHPGKLPRPLREAICSSCHLGGAAAVPVRGRQISDFRPGRPLTDYRIHYRAEGADEPMAVVGHAEQLRLSACYQKSGAMTCLSCHDPHARARPADRVAYYRGKCLTCHSQRGCKLDLPHRLEREPADDCASCHMPRGKTEVPHVAFTHHRIGLHPQKPPPGPAGAPRLVPIDDSLLLAPPDHERNLGLAYLTARRNPAYARHAAEFLGRARAHLESAYGAGLRDAETVLGLAELSWRGDPVAGAAHAREGLAARDASPRARVRALTVLAHDDFRNDDPARAIPELEELGRLQRFADDWRVLGLSRLRTNSPTKAVAALEKAVEIRPFRPSNHSALADAYYRVGETRLAEEHRRKARWLRDHNQD
jgi:hypothetical protein